MKMVQVTLELEVDDDYSPEAIESALQKHLDGQGDYITHNPHIHHLAVVEVRPADDRKVLVGIG